ncbi:hypothetical protein PGT21_015833 [Puccinia graminis f. sp. tritici]|uniref:Uncharacterized protein n=1 Tax=Puccinia graminis f. sp. tritici TaxID=56615 RepID=A0A5B0MJ23_PUCGR|nr:hypothetical protein PGT21_015833 [Puccinia graminis f. sp. tritici]KAA1126843.1 hypothetical protein PGTUg99_027825 [Puccinia graminis f. sp. tritici]
MDGPIYQHGDPVARQFKDLQRKYFLRAARLPNPTYLEDGLAALSIHEFRTQETLANHLLSSLLPLLQGQINSLSLALDPASLRNQPVPNLDLISNIQPEIDDNLEQIKALLNTLCPEHPTLPNRTDDYGLKRFKFCRLYRLKIYCEVPLSCGMCEIFQAADELIQQVVFTSEPPIHDYSHDIESIKNRLHGSVSRASDTIKMMADCFQASELVVAQQLWTSQRLEVENQFRSIVKNLNRSADSDGKYLRQSVIRLAKLSLLIFKLCKIFFAKLSERGLAHERLPVHTEISSEQVEILAQSAELVAKDLQELKDYLGLANRQNRDVTSDGFLRIVNSLRNRFEAPLFAVLIHFIPSIPDTHGLDHQKYYQNWCLTWHNLMALAVHNFTLVAKTYTNNIP